MTKKSKEEQKAPEELKDSKKSESSQAKTVKKEAPAPSFKKSRPKARPARKFSFDQWAKRKGVKPHHMAGLRAYCSNPHKPRTLDEWEKVFVNY